MNSLNFRHPAGGHTRLRRQGGGFDGARRGRSHRHLV